MTISIVDQVYLTREDIVRAGDCSRPIRLDHYRGEWWIYDLPVIDVWGRVGPVRAERSALPADMVVAV
jgi:hypothetical protein